MKSPEFKSDEEYWMYYWLLSLQHHGFVREICYEPEPIELFDGAYSVGVLTGSRKPKTVRKVMFNPTEYTMDFSIVIDERLSGHLFMTPETFWKNNKVPFISVDENSGIVFLEVKPEYDFKNMNRMVKNTLKWVYDKYKIYINMVHPTELFEKTFAPYEYYFSRKTGKPRKSAKQCKTIEQWLKDVSEKQIQS